MVVQNNLLALNATNMFHKNVKLKTKSMEKLGSGYKVNRAADDAAALSITEKMRNQIRGLNRAVRNVEEGISYVQVADGALSEIHSMLHRIEELAVQAANDTNAQEDRESIDHEVQSLKEEIESVFEKTEFNGLKIWDTDLKNRIQIGTEKRQALKITSSGKSLTIKEHNKAAVAYDKYKINVRGTDPNDPDNYGFTVDWTGWNGQSYSTNLISFDEVKVGDKLSFSVNVKDYIDTTTYPELEGIDFKIGWKMEEAATISDVASSINGVSFSISNSSSESLKITPPATGVSMSVSTNYMTELASERNVEAYDTSWIEPVGGGANVITHPTYTDPHEDTGWEIQFDVRNVGTVTARATRVSFSSGDRSDAAEGTWWEWREYTNGTRSQVGLSYTPTVGTTGSLQNIMDAITDADGSGNSLVHDSQVGGTIQVSFTLTPDSGSVSYGGHSSSTVGTMSMTITVDETDTEETLMRKMQAALNENTVIDVYEGSEATNRPNASTHYVSSGSAKKHEIDAPIYQSVHDLVIQSGANSGDTMHIIYKSLRIRQLGLEDSEVLDHETASETIQAVQGAVKIISAQRSLFGAYANRMEHTVGINSNYAENLQAAESGMRDTDMAEEVTRNAKYAILEQVAQTIIANANQQKQSVLQLLQ